MANARTTKSNESPQDQRIEETLRRLPDGGEALATVHDATAKSILKLAEQLVKNARERLGPETSKPRVVEVGRLFSDHAGPTPSMPKQLNAVLRSAERVEQVAELDETWDKSIAGAVDVFDQTSIESGSKVQEATDNWRLAVRVYESEARSAGAIFKAEIDKAALKGGSQGGSHPELDQHVDYYARSAEISAGLVKYEEAMAAASGELATALGTLIQDLFESAAKVSVAEATFIDSTQQASSTFWTGVHGEMTNR